MSAHGLKWRQAATPRHARLGVFELLVTDEAIRAQIHNRASEAAIRETARHNGMLSMREDGERWLADGSTSEAELVRVTKE